MEIIKMTIEHWPQVKSIYESVIAVGQATFQTFAPDWSEWDKAHIENCRLVETDNGKVIGCAALTPVTGRCVYAGVGEVSVYIDESTKGKGIGKVLLKELIKASELHNFWTLQAGIFP